MKLLAVLMTALLASPAFAQSSPAATPVFRGEWKGSAGPALMHGRWAGQADSRNPNEAHGSWTLHNDSGQTTAEGTWSARKIKSQWRGTWTARPAGGRFYSGTWTADASAANARSFAEMMQQSLAREISGAWRSGRLGGHWWLRAFTAGK
jgi:hypothetical protein